MEVVSVEYLMDLSIDGHTLLVRGLSNRLGQSRLLVRKAHWLPQQTDWPNVSHATHLGESRTLCTKYLTSSWELGLETASFPCADTIRSDEMWHTGRLSFCVGLGAACRCKGWRRRKPLGSQWRRRKLPAIWGYSGSFPLSLHGNTQRHCFCMGPSEDSAH
jgi:hypothetical protein